MTLPPPLDDINAPSFAEDFFNIATLDDEIRVDGLCGRLLQTFCRDLVAAGEEPLRAGQLARGADYFLREFIIADRHDNLFHLDPLRVRQFAGHWYIIRNLEPNAAELRELLSGVEAFYRYCAEHDKVPRHIADAIAIACHHLDYYAERIEAFWAIVDDGFAAWQNGCPLQSPNIYH
ncbi:MAG: hypothetical protein A2091_06925 [Desulfuromonadales bacterium GWD2_61_12]|nr:MAG: hypothetical protein A2091_06925 [Desulfuromonadales bacterium GWD2_61_12]OGR33326.1 MAG: hypothetical protein A2005_01755 [Desulfuromonadales bacterium GWC2_61_20]HAD03696.1 hypothetical protein [Desulfuromonas sp.]HBT82406.1 hypothetical protein [Desulfuromonas sp.]